LTFLFLLFIEELVVEAPLFCELEVGSDPVATPVWVKNEKREV
jgi:hypothetical protein